MRSRRWLDILLYVVASVQAEVLVVQADTDIAFYVNGAEIFADTSSPVLPMNGVRRVNAWETSAVAYRTSRTLEVGDLIAMQVSSRYGSLVNVTDALGRSTEYPAYVGVILVSEFGTMSSSAFKCFTQKESTEGEITPFQSVNFNDSHWPRALEQAENCCPWRDYKVMAWERLGATWVGLPTSTFGQNVSGPREMFCRYTIRGTDLRSRLPDTETVKASAFAPEVTIVSVELSVSISKMDVMVDRPANIYCGVIDVRYELRVPTHNELRDWGVPALELPGSTYGYQRLGDSEFTNQELDYPAIMRISVDELADCEQECSIIPECAALVYWVQGFDFATGTNCKLVNNSYNISERMDPNDFSSMQLRERIVVPVIYTLTYSGMLLPGTLYNVYCSAEDFSNGLHSNMSFITSTRITQRTDGCIDCGSTDPPAVAILGGWVEENSVGVAAASSRSGRIFCHARNTSSLVQVTAAEVQDTGFSNLATVGGQTVAIIITGLEASTQHQVACVAEADGGLLSVQEQIDVTRRLLNTSSTEVTINSMEVTREESPTDTLFNVMTTTLRVDKLGYAYCQVFPSDNLMNTGVPDTPLLEELGDRAKVTDLTTDVMAEFDQLDKNFSYEIWCTSKFDDFSNETDADLITTPYPVASIKAEDVGYQSVAVTVSLSKTPAHVFCDAFPWALRPSTSRPEAPKLDQMARSPFNTVLDLVGVSGTVVIDIGPLTSGTYYDLYCYSEFYRPPPPPGAIQPPRQGMDNEGILATRRQIRVKGPQFDELGWECVSGRNCSIDNILGQGLSMQDQVMVREDDCPGRCQCLGVVDSARKGGSCSPISQSELVVSGVGVDDKQDPRGAWCYVTPGTCPDEEASVLFPSMTLSYKVCTYNEQLGSLPTAPPGFPNRGLVASPGSGGRAYVVSAEAMVAPGAIYSLCWCNGTESSCAFETDFRVRLGAMHMAGPSALQQELNMSCRVGLPCTVGHFGGHALEPGSRLVALPLDPAGCLWRRASLADPQGIPNFPNLGVSEPYDKELREYDFQGEPLRIPGGRYTLCWCGPKAKTWHIAPGQAYRIPDGITPEPCPPDRPDDGGKFLSPAGSLVVIGPTPIGMISCRLGALCSLQLQGLGLQGSDRLMALSQCGQGALPPVGWTDGAQSLQEPWVDAGWVKSVAFSTEELFAMGVPVSDAAAAAQAAAAADADGGLSNVSRRGAYGFPNFGVTLPHAQAGYHHWGGPVWAFAGTYVLCWCGADATVDGCRRPEDFLMPVARLEITGPGTLPNAAQMFTCMRRRGCELSPLAGTQPPASKLLVAAGACGGYPLRGMPRSGQSFPSLDGRAYSWGGDRVMAHPGRYNLCWCPEVSDCDRYENFISYAGILRVKAPEETPSLFVCPLAKTCNITGIAGQGLNNDDQVMVLTKCGEAVVDAETFEQGSVSLATFDEGGSFTLPPGSRAGTFQVCWCPGEQLCLNAVDFSITLGRVIIGGPQDSVTYRCFEWEACTISDLEGANLAEGDRLVVVPDGTDCLTSGGNPTRQENFPNNAVSFPATAEGKDFSWGPGLVRAAPGYYALCWCHAPYNGGVCTEEGPFNIPGGALRIGDSREFQYVTRPEDNPPRDSDALVALLLALPLPLLFFGAIFLGVKRLIGRKKAQQDETNNPWAERMRVDHLQERSKLQGDVVEVAETRNKISQLADARARDQVTGSKDGLMALYGMLRNFARDIVAPKKVLKRAGPLRPAPLRPAPKRGMSDHSLRSAAQSTTDSISEDFSFDKKVEESSDDEVFTKKPKAGSLSIHEALQPCMPA
ncbi:unnamed protein product [Effrenium voratum]|nr:unnamed protein product [Effrenium voratum]